MLDLLVALCATHHLSPGSHTIIINNPSTGRQMEYKASQTVGTLGVNTMTLVNKQTELQKKQQQQRDKKMQPFEVGLHTYAYRDGSFTGWQLAFYL